jgi:tripartite-type tricarboxylate transporter receptor subunit TctC
VEVVQTQVDAEQDDGWIVRERQRADVTLFEAEDIVPAAGRMEAPAGTPNEIVQALNEALAVALKDPAVRATLEAQGDEVSYSTPKDFAAFVNAESTTWTKVVRTADIQLD